MEITKSTRIAYAEIDSFIELLPKEEKEKIPSKLKQYFKAEKDKETTKNCQWISLLKNKIYKKKLGI